MHRREFLKASAGALAAGVVGCAVMGTSAPSIESHNIFDPYFLPLLSGFLQNAKNTSADYVVCDYPHGTKLKSCCTPSGKTYTSVSRMLPALAEWARCERQATIGSELSGASVEEVLLKIYSKAFDPKHPDFWGYAPATKATQLSVEAALVAYSLWRLGDSFIERIPAPQRKNLNAWLASCTQVPERDSNHAWFTCNNQAVRLALGKTWPEFAGDERWMIEDLKALDALYKPDNDGWYSDSPQAGVYDYYNFYAFPNFSLYWSRIIGKRYPDWNDKVRARNKEFFQKTPYFISTSGWHPLYGRSLIYRWTLATGPILGYQEGLWPHAPGLLRRMMRKNIEAHWNAGAFDAKDGKLLETLSPGGSPDVRERYVDNGHPYWCMGAFAALGIPASDRFWTDQEEPLPVEKRDFIVQFKGPRMALVGTQRTGEVKWIHALPAERRDYYRDKYMKFCYSSDFPFNTLQTKGQCPPDQMLVFRDAATGTSIGRTSCDSGELLDDGVRTRWRIMLGEHEITIDTRIRIGGEFEHRSHDIHAPAGVAAVEILEGSYPLGLSEGEEVSLYSVENRMMLRAKSRLLCSWMLGGFDAFDVIDSVAEKKNLNVLYPAFRVIVMKTKVVPGRMKLSSLHYASAKPLDENLILVQAGELEKQWEIH